MINVSVDHLQQETVFCVSCLFLTLPQSISSSDRISEGSYALINVPVDHLQQKTVFLFLVFSQKSFSDRIPEGLYAVINVSDDHLQRQTALRLFMKCLCPFFAGQTFWQDFALKRLSDRKLEGSCAMINVSLISRH